MNYPYRECACGNQIHVGGIYECEECLNLEVEEKQIRQMTEKQLLIEILKHLKATPTTDGERMTMEYFSDVMAIIGMIFLIYLMCCGLLWNMFAIFKALD